MQEMETLALRGVQKRDNGLRVALQPWGYVIRSGHKVPFGMLVGQLFAYFMGVSFVTAGVGLLLVPGLLSEELGAMRLGAAALLGAGAAYLLWFASRGSMVDVEFDNEAREIREVIQNRVGRQTVVARYAFADIGGAYVETAAGEAPAQLVLRYRGNMILVAEGGVETLTILRNQLSRDLMGPNLPTRPSATRNRSTRAQNRAA